MEIHFATTNGGKILEIERICTNLPSQKQAISVVKFDISKIEEPEEDGLTFAENSEIKFLYYEQFSQKLEKNKFLITEDSGFEIHALEGFPSIYSARFLKQFNTKKEAFLEIKRMLEEKNLPIQNQKASFVCDICTRIDGEIKHFYGTVEGIISFEKIGDEGFGYDPIFIPNNSTQTFAEMKGAEKDLTSHRAQAFSQFLNYIS
jgi:XTP/dITP diphosphohydrolase